MTLCSAYPPSGPTGILSSQLTGSSFRWIDTIVAGTGMATSVTTTSMTDNTQLWTVNQFVGDTLTMGGKTAVVTSNTATILSFGGWSGSGMPALGAYTVGTSLKGVIGSDIATT